MKKILFCLVVALGLMGCDGKIIEEPEYRSRFIYFNKCSTDVSIKTFAADKPSDIILRQTYTIPPEGNHILEFTNGYSANDIYWTYWGWGGGVSAVISNGEKQVSIPDYMMEGIYNPYNYLVYSEESGDVTWIYAFTDEFFADGEPIEPSEP